MAFTPSALNASRRRSHTGGNGDADASAILVHADTLELHHNAIERESRVGVEAQRADPKRCREVIPPKGPARRVITR